MPRSPSSPAPWSLIVVVAASLGGGASDGGSGHGSKAGTASSRAAEARRPRPAYVVESGDTLTSIAHDTGVSVARIQALNPEVDPQILISGEKLKLR